MNILVTGAGGFIGNRLLHALACEAGVEAYALSRHKLEMQNVVICQGDIMDAVFLDSIFRNYRFDVVVHLAAITEHDAIVNHRMESLQLNLQGTGNLLKCFNNYCKDSLFLYASSGKVYGKTNEMPISEAAYVNPQNILGKTKRIAEEVLELNAEPSNRYLICRIFNIYGEHQKRNFIVPTIIDQLDQPVIHLGNLTDLRDYLYIDDLVAALVACVRSSRRFAPVDFVNIGSGQPASVADILREMEGLLGRKLSVETEERRMRHDETPVEFCSYEKLSMLTGWKPRYSLREGLRKTLRAESVLS